MPATPEGNHNLKEDTRLELKTSKYQEITEYFWILNKNLGFFWVQI